MDQIHCKLVRQHVGLSKKFTFDDTFLCPHSNHQLVNHHAILYHPILCMRMPACVRRTWLVVDGHFPQKKGFARAKLTLCAPLARTQVECISQQWLSTPLNCMELCNRVPFSQPPLHRALLVERPISAKWD